MKYDFETIIDRQGLDAIAFDAVGNGGPGAPKPGFDVIPMWIADMDFAVARGLQGRMDDLHEIGRYRRYSSVDADLVLVNQMIKYLKFGFGFATDEACYDIREGRLSREDAIWYINEYDGKCGAKYIKSACDYMGISEDLFWKTVDKFVNKKLFYKDEQGRYNPKFIVGKDYEESM